MVKKSYYREKSRDDKGSRKRSEDFYDEDERITLKFGGVKSAVASMMAANHSNN